MPGHHTVVSPVPRGTWTEVLARDPNATIYQTPQWFDAARRLTGGQDVSRLYTTEDGRRLLLPLLRNRPIPRVFLDASYPGRLGSGGILADGGLRRSDVQLVLADLAHSPAVSTRMKANHDVADLWEAGLVAPASLTRFRVEVVDLDGGFPQVWKSRFRDSARKNARKAERSGLTVERDQNGRLVPELYDIYLHWTLERAASSGIPASVAVRLARRREPRPMFEELATSLGAASRIWVARHEGEPIAALMTLVHGDHAVSFRGYSKKVPTSQTRANNLLYKLAIEDACESGCRFFSMGESSGVAGLERFKQTLGATPRSAVECRIERVPLARVEAVPARMEAVAARMVGAVRRRMG